MDAAGASKARILIVDDEGGVARVAARTLGEEAYACETFTSVRLALAALDHADADLIVTDLMMPEMDGIELMRQVRERFPGLPVILLTADASVRRAVAAMREGAFDYVTKPFNEEELRATVAHALGASRAERPPPADGGGTKSEITFIAESQHSRELVALLRRVAPSRSTVLIQGDSGTGKELVAWLLHHWSGRAGAPFVAINCRAFAEGVLESELFGHEKGAFTGAIAARAGCFERAAGGTLFLDEIGEISPEFQAKLLRVLQDGEVLRVGATRPRKVQVRVMAATNRVLRNEISAGRFREDLFFRLNVIPIQVLPLRQRREDILPLARYFLSRHSARTGRRLVFTARAEERLLSHTWVGNIRELENVIERAVVLSAGDWIDADNLVLEESVGQATNLGDYTLQEYLDRAATTRIRAALEAARGSRGLTAQLLGVNRTTLYRTMKRLGLTPEAAGKSRNWTDNPRLI